MRLAEISPDAVALDAARRVVTAHERLSWQLQPGVTVQTSTVSDETLRATQIYLSTLDLAQYAQTGAGEEAEVPDLVLSVVSALSTRPLDAGQSITETPEALIDDLDEDDAVSFICVAAWARLQLSQDERLNTSQVASLAGLAPSRVRALSEAGELATATEPTRKGGTLYAAKEVRRFLGARGVAGY